MNDPSGPNPRVDWEAAKAFYIALPAEERSYTRISAQFGVSEVSVGKWARRQDWPAQAAEADRKAGEKAVARIVRSRAERIVAYTSLVDDYVDAVAAKLKTDDLDVKAADLPGLVKTAELLLGEPTDRIQVSQLQPLLDSYDRAVERLVELAGDRTEADSVVARLDEDLLAFAARTRTAETT